MRSRSPSGAASLRSRTIAAATAVWVSIAVSSAFALVPDQPFHAYVRTHFTTEDGLPGGVVDAIQQTPDGFLWLRTNGYLLTRFDGRHFQAFEGIQANALAVAPNGDLWVGTREGLLRMPLDTLRRSDLSGAISFQPSPGAAINIGSLLFDRKGVLWVGTGDGLFRFEDGRFSPVGPRVGIIRMELAANGRFLLVTKEGFLELEGSEVVPSPGLAVELGTKAEDVYHVLKDRRGNVWYCCAQGVARRSGTQLQKLPPYGPEGHGAFQAYEDAQGTVWVVKTEGLFRSTGTALELAVPKMRVRALFGDRDGNLWVGTDGDGLYRFRDPAVRMFTTADGLPNDVIMTVLSVQDGSLWIGANCGGLSRLDGTRFRTYDEKNGLLNSCVWALAQDAQHDLWIGTWGGGAFRLHQGAFTQFLEGETVTSIVAARDGSLWFATRRGLVVMRDGSVRTYTTRDGLSSNRVFKILEDRTGTILAGGPSGLYRLVGDRFESVREVSGAVVWPMGEDRSGGLFVNAGVPLRLEGRRVEAVPELGGQIHLVETASGELWFGGQRGIRSVPPHSFARTRPRDEPLDSEPFDIPDGLAATEVSAGHPSMALAADGRLWIATARGLAMLDTRRSPRTTDPPTIYVREVTVGRETQPAPGELSLPPGTSHVEVDFAAVEISSPEKIRMQYKLDGVDSQWLDARPDPRAIYSGLPVGRRALRIRACNRHGIWDRSGVVYVISQQPHFYQTRWFLAVAIGIGLLVVGGAYRLRVRHVSRRLSARFDERLAERTRVARELHDTFLQTVQGSKLVVDHALKDPDDHARLLRAVKQLAGWLDRAIEEGRAALNSLRTSVTETNDLGEALGRAIEECRSQTRLDATLSVTGDARELHPMVRDEVYRIGYEAIRNACSHSAAEVLRVTLEHDHDLTLRVLDDGVGMDPAISETGKQGHFGLSGMRERAERIGGKLTIASLPGSGTTITVTVPGRLAYRTRGPGRWRRTTSGFSPD